MEKFTEVFLGNKRPAVFLSFKRMAEHLAVLLIALLCLVTTSSCDDTSHTCGKYPGLSPSLAPSFETKQGTPIKSITVSCNLWGGNTAWKMRHTYMYDISSLVRTFVTPEVDNASLVTFSLSFWCLLPTEIRFNNSRNIVYNNISLFLRLDNCMVSTLSLLVLVNATDLRGWDSDDWLSSSRSILPEERKKTFATSLKEISYAGLSLNDINIAAVFNDTQKDFSNLAKLEVYVPYRFKKISTDQWRLTMPNLQ